MSKVKCYSVRLESLISISEKAYKATAFDGTTAIIPKSQVFGQDYDVQKSNAYWISSWILGQKELQYSSKKESWFEKELSHASNEGVEIERHVPEEKEAVEVEPIAELVKDEITTSYIFRNGKVLTLSIAKTLVGKKLACTNPEYKYNTPSKSEFVLTDIVTEWDDAKKREYPKVDESKYTQYLNYQDYWASYFSAERIEQSKNTLLLQTETGTIYKCELNNGYFSEPTFYGSDADREVYFIEL